MGSSAWWKDFPWVKQNHWPTSERFRFCLFLMLCVHSSMTRLPTYGPFHEDLCVNAVIFSSSCLSLWYTVDDFWYAREYEWIIFKNRFMTHGQKVLVGIQAQGFFYLEVVCSLSACQVFLLVSPFFFWFENLHVRAHSDFPKAFLDRGGAAWNLVKVQLHL